MEFIQVISPEDFRTVEIYSSYCTTFPECERRSEVQFQDLFSKENVKVYSVLDDLKTVGYIIIWELSDGVFVEHFEIFSEFRSMKYGTEIISKLFRDYSNIILEAEPENLNEDSKRRIAFYQKNGFAVIDANYMQPSYGDGKQSLNLWLLCNWKPENVLRIKEEIYDTVYR